MIRLIPITLLVALAAGIAGSAEPREISWDDLLPKEAAGFDDPFEELSEEQLVDLGMVARIRYLLEAEKISADGPDAAEEKRLVAKLGEEGVDIDYLLSQRERVAQARRERDERVDAGISGQLVKIPGYMLPIVREEGRVLEFLLVPWVGACIHTPPPPPNQMVHVRVPGGAEDRGRFAAIWIEGEVELDPRDYKLFLVDGTRSVKVAYTMETGLVSEYSSRESDILAKVEVPELGAEHGWWQRMQTKVSLLFTKTMTGIRDRESSAALWMGLLIAFVYGVVHTLGPGHGKAVVISYFVGQGGSFGRGVRMGVQIAVFHVLSAIVVVWLTDFAVRQATGKAPSDYRLVKLVSYAAIVVIGALMLVRAIRASRAVKGHQGHHEAHGHGHHEGCQVCETLGGAEGPSAWLALAVGSVPCTGALLVLLFGMANDLLGAAIAMVVAISIGMALAMSAIGVLAILGRKFVDRKLESDAGRQQRFAARARIAGACAVMLVGMTLFALTLTLDRQTPIPPIAEGAP